MLFLLALVVSTAVMCAGKTRCGVRKQSWSHCIDACLRVLHVCWCLFKGCKLFSLVRTRHSQGLIYEKFRFPFPPTQLVYNTPFGHNKCAILQTAQTVLYYRDNILHLQYCKNGCPSNRIYSLVLSAADKLVRPQTSRASWHKNVINVQLELASI